MRDEHEMTAQEYWQMSDDIDAGLYMMEHPSHPRAVPLTPAHTQALAERREAFLRMMRRGNSTTKDPRTEVGIINPEMLTSNRGGENEY
jgi:hypothetical protein